MSSCAKWPFLSLLTLALLWRQSQSADNPEFASQFVYTQSSLTFKITPPNEVYQNSRIVITLPYYKSDTSFFQSSTSPDPSCSAVTGINAGLTCSGVDHTSTHNVTIFGGFSSAAVPSSTEIKFIVANLYTPLSVGSVVGKQLTENGINVYIQTSSGKTYMQVKNLTVKVNSPRNVTSYQVSRSNSKTGEVTNTFSKVKFSAPILAGSYVQLTTTAGFDLTSSTVPAPAMFVVSPTSTIAKINQDLDQTLSSVDLYNIVNRDRVLNSSIRLSLYDSAGNLAQVSNIFDIVFEPNVIQSPVLSFNPTVYGMDSMITLNFTTNVAYGLGTYFRVTTPIEFPKLSSLTCQVNLAGSVPCSNSADIITVSNAVNSLLAKGTAVSLNISSLTMPHCGSSYTYEVLSMSSDNYQIEKVSIAYSTTSLTQMPLTLVPLYANDSSSAAPVEYQLQFNHPGVLKAGSNFIITLPAGMEWINGVSTCVLSQGLASGATCNYNQADRTVRINSGVTSDRPNTAINIIVNLKNLVNPKGRGSYIMKVDVLTSTLCTYATGNFNLTIDKISSMIALSIKPETFFLNSYVTYNFSVTPKTTLILSGEYLLLTLPSSVALTSSVSCTKWSDNLVSINCAKVNDTSLRVNINVDSIIYANSQLLLFSVSYLKNPSTAGQISGMNMALMTSTNNEYEIHNTSILVYGSYATPTNVLVSFGSKYRGHLDTVDYTLKVNSYLPSGTVLQIKLSDKFSMFGNFSVRQSSPTMRIQSTDNSSNIMRLAFANEVPPNTEVKITLNGNNPTAEAIGSEDIQMILYSDSTTNYIFSIMPLTTGTTFVCDTSCKDCGQVYNYCTLCAADFELKDGKCNQKIVPPQLAIAAKEVSVPFIFLSIAVIIVLVMFIVGCLCKKRIYWANATYSLLRPNFLVALGVYCFLVWKNEDPRWLWYGILAAIGIHVILCVLAFIKLRKGIFTGKFGAQVSTNKFVNAFASSSKKHNEDIKQKFGTVFRIVLYLTPVFQFSLIRWYFSSKKEEKGLLWHFETESFEYIKSVLQRFQMIYVFFVVLTIIIITSVSLALNIYLFKIEMIALCIIDLMIYIWAYLELNPLRKRLTKANDWESGPLSAKEPMIDSSGMPIADGDKSNAEDGDQEGDPKKLSPLERLRRKQGKSSEKARVGPDGKLVGPLDSYGGDQDSLYDSQGNPVGQPLNTVIAMPLRIDGKKDIDGLRESITPGAINDGHKSTAKKHRRYQGSDDDGDRGFVSSSDEDNPQNILGSKDKSNAKKKKRDKRARQGENGEVIHDSPDGDDYSQTEEQSLDGIAVGVPGHKNKGSNKKRDNKHKSDQRGDNYDRTAEYQSEDESDQVSEYIDERGEPVNKDHPFAIKVKKDKIKKKRSPRNKIGKDGLPRADSDVLNGNSSNYGDGQEEYEIVEGVKVAKTDKIREKNVPGKGKDNRLSTSYLHRGDEDGETVLSGEERDPDVRLLKRHNGDEDGEYMRADEERKPFGYPQSINGIKKADNPILGFRDNNYIIDEPNFPSEPNITPATGALDDSKMADDKPKKEKEPPKPVQLPPSQFIEDEEGVLRPIPDDPVPVKLPLVDTDPSVDKQLAESTKNYSDCSAGANSSYRFKSQNKPLSDIKSNIGKQETPANSIFNRYYNDSNKDLAIILEQNENEEDSRVTFFSEPKKLEDLVNPSIPSDPNDPRQALSPSERAQAAQKEWHKKRKRKGPKAHLEMLDDNGNLVVVPEYDDDDDYESEYIDEKDVFIPGGGQSSGTDLYVPGAGNRNNPFTDDDEPSVPGALKGDALKDNLSNKIIEDDINNPDDDYLTKNDKIDLHKDGRLQSINGQLIEDINSNHLKDKNGVGLNLAKQRTKDLLRGILCDNRGKKFFCNFNSINELKKGILRTFDNEPVYLKDQDFDELKRGVLKDEKGNVVEINGQRMTDIDRGVLRMQNGDHLIRMSDQDKTNLNRGIVVCPDGSKVFMGRAQKYDDFSKGLIKAMDGSIHRMIDQNLRDFIKGNLNDTALKKNQENQKEKNRRANQLFDKLQSTPGIFGDAGGSLTPRRGGLNPGSQIGGIPNKHLGLWNDPMMSPEASLQSIHNPELQKSMCYFDKDGNPIKLSKLMKNPKVYDSLGNVILIENDSDLIKMYDSDGKVIKPENIKDAPILYDLRGKPLFYNNIGFIHKFYDKHGGLVDYKALERQDVIFNEKKEVVPVDPLEKRTRYCNDEGKPLTREQLDRHQGALHDDFVVKYSALDLLRRQRIYDRDGNILNHKTILTSQLLHDKAGNIIGEVDNPDHLPLPYFENSHRKPIDLHDAIGQYLYFNKKKLPVTREDVERDLRLQDWKGRKFTVEETTDIVENPNDPRRIYGANGREVKVDYEVRKEMLRDDHRRRIDIEDLRRRGKLFDGEGKPVTGKILSRIRELLDKKDNTVRPTFSEMGDAEFSDRRTERSRSILSKQMRRVVTPHTNGRQSKKDLESEYGNLETLQLNLLADESVDIEVNIIEDDQSGDYLNQDHTINVDEQPHDNLRTDGMQIVIDPGQTSSTFGNAIVPNRPLNQDHNRVKFTNSEREPSETSRGSRFQNAAMNKMSAPNNWIEEKPAQGNLTNKKISYFESADEINKLKNISPVSETRSLMQEKRPTSLTKGDKKKAPLPPKLDMVRMHREDLDQSRKTVGGGFISTKNAQPVSFVKPYKRKTSLGRKPSLMSGFKPDGLKEIYIDNIAHEKEKHTKAMQGRPPSNLGATSSIKSFFPNNLF